ncbi:MAG: UvrD-helicase domain-containing protein [Propionibacterium sp.]|nr:UvrD-helicase domain-containing protein [Propionibacterium sp.]
MISIIMTQQGNQLDAGVRQRAFAFLSKITTDDTTPGLHIEPIVGSRDPRVRTGRVDQQYRAVLFKLTSGADTTYVFHGVWNHDDAIAVAQRAELRVNPVNGMPEIRDVEDERALAGVRIAPQGPRESSPWGPTPGTPDAERVQINATHDQLVDVLGLPGPVADAVLAATNDEELEAAGANGPAWQRNALVGLGAGMSVDEVLADLGLVPGAAEVPAGPASDEDLLRSLDQPAASIEFARIDGVDELRRVIESGDFGAWRVFLHPQQRRFAEQRTNGAFRLSGGAGTGKTVVLLHRAKHLLDADDHSRLVLTTYTVNLATAMSRDLARLDPGLARAAALGERGAHVAGIDAIARQVLRSAGPDVRHAVEQVLGVGHAEITRPTPHTAWRDALSAAGGPLPERLRSAHFFSSEYERVILPAHITTRDDYLRARRPGRGVRLTRAERAAVWQVVEAYRLSSRMGGAIDFQEAATIAAVHLERLAAEGGGRLADHVLVDEGQDMTPAHWQLARALVSEGPDDLFIAEDSHQRIYGNRLTLSRYGIAIRGRSRRLTLNYRTTAQNLHYAVTILAGGSYEDLEAEPESTDGYRSARTGPQPVLRGFPSLTEELDFAASTITGWRDDLNGDQLDTIAVLVRDSRQRDLVVTGLGDRGVEVRAVDRDQPRPGLPVVMTMHRAKGTEFAKVLLFGISAGSVPMPLREYETSDEDLADAMLRERSLLYVAASRARDELVVTWSGEPSALVGRA